MANICRACACALTILLAAQGLSAQAPRAADETFKQAQQKLREETRRRRSRWYTEGGRRRPRLGAGPPQAG